MVCMLLYTMACAMLYETHGVRKSTELSGGNAEMWVLEPTNTMMLLLRCAYFLYCCMHM